ncbi:guanyl-specific ribonuclease Sa [Herbihabitans rhizosphaerae]|uniref:Guanyl-specific ribonuclease Sa n=1 Tax=Herbihabitans rhizosphaerae TaxID=1872711 RepID=A0A4Q7KIR6_9PSEU|nr:ribonuclease domain-containing protein [Herbihabitans rhizosphaerae]RZS34820.1 guanyl-specific ribonuclease Sa [Herbihabitans rhizosphaerae]
MTKTRGAAVRGLSLLALLFALCAATVSSPAPAAATEAGINSVYPTCTMSRCADAKKAYDGWRQLNFPTSRNWYSWPYGQYNFAGGQFYNREGQLPKDHKFYEYDVYPRAKGASRDAHRIVRDTNTGTVWYSPDHYENFYKIV